MVPRWRLRVELLPCFGVADPLGPAGPLPADWALRSVLRISEPRNVVDGLAKEDLPAVERNREFLAFLSLVNRTINLVFFFQIFKGFTLLPWQKVGRI